MSVRYPVGNVSIVRLTRTFVFKGSRTRVDGCGEDDSAALRSSGSAECLTLASSDPRTTIVEPTSAPRAATHVSVARLNLRVIDRRLRGLSFSLQATHYSSAPRHFTSLAKRSDVRSQLHHRDAQASSISVRGSDVVHNFGYTLPQVELIPHCARGFLDCVHCDAHLVRAFRADPPKDVLERVRTRTSTNRTL